MTAEYLHRRAYCGNLKEGIILPQYHNLQRLFISAIQTLNSSLKVLAFEWLGMCLFYFSLPVVLAVTDGLPQELIQTGLVQG